MCVEAHLDWGDAEVKAWQHRKNDVGFREQAEVKPPDQWGCRGGIFTGFGL